MLNKETRYNWPEIAGMRGDYKLVSKDKLHVDTEYQRPQLSNARILKYAVNWDWALCGVLLVADRGGVLYVMDGQQRLAAAKKRSDVDRLPCAIYKTQGKEWEASVFWRFNSINKRPTAHEVYKAKIVSGDKNALALCAFMESRGYEINTNGGAKDIDFVGSISRYQATNSKRTFDALDLCFKVGEGSHITAPIFIGFYSILSNGITLDELAIQKLRKAGLVEISQEITKQIAANGTDGGVSIAKALLKVANHQRSTRRIELPDGWVRGFLR